MIECYFFLPYKWVCPLDQYEVKEFFNFFMFINFGQR